MNTNEAKEALERAHADFKTEVDVEIRQELSDLEKDAASEEEARRAKIRYLTQLMNSNRSTWSGGAHSTSNVIEKIVHDTAESHLCDWRSRLF